MKNTILKFVLSSIIVLFPMLSHADIVDEIEARKEIIVGVKTDYKPYGFLDASGRHTGIEVDLAKNVAEKLKVAVRFVPVVSSNRIEFLEQGKIDLMIATMTDKPERRKRVLASTPNYYSSGTNVIALKSYDFNQWEELSGRKVCGINGAFYNDSIKQKFGAELVIYKSTDNALRALSGGSCIAFVFDDSFIAGLLTDEKWSENYEMPFETIDDAPWALSVRKGENRLHTIMNEIIIDWHKTGRILGLEAKYGLRNTSYAIRTHQKYNEILKVFKNK
ncbi:MAG: transporter substrate-binding domain-containing protein [Arenicella sp.]